MPRLELLGLDLRSDLPFSGLENPPMTGAPLAGKAFLPDASGALAEAGLGEDMDEGQEELFLFDPDDTVFVIHARGLNDHEKRQLRRRLR